MSRLDRLYAVTERLRAAAPRLVTVAALAAELEVSRRTVQRDLQVLLGAGVPVRYEEGRGGGWTVDPSMTLPPVNLTADEAAALLLAAAAARYHAPLGAAADRAVAKVLAAVSGGTARAAAEWERRVHVDPGPSGAGPPGAVRAVEAALAGSRALHLEYRDAAGAPSSRVVEPVGLLTSGGRWYLIAWCRTRDAVRGFRLDRIVGARPLDEPVAPRELAVVLREEAGRVGRTSDGIIRKTGSAAPGPGLTM